jgi:FKBP-type peptidyl-prolyl cis-trans isomerase
MFMRNILLIVIAVSILLFFGYLVFTGKILAPSSVQTTQAPKAASSQGLKIEDIKVGTGREVKSGDTIVINYIGRLSNGTVFSSTYDSGQPFTTPIGTGDLIKGWDLGIVGMKVGGKRKLTIPPSLGYGDKTVGSIPPNSTLTFEVELLSVK